MGETALDIFDRLEAENLKTIETDIFDRLKVEVDTLLEKRVALTDDVKAYVRTTVEAMVAKELKKREKDGLSTADVEKLVSDTVAKVEAKVSKQISERTRVLTARIEEAFGTVEKMKQKYVNMRNEILSQPTYTFGGPSPQTRIATLGCSIDGGGAAITTGIKGHIAVPYNATIKKVTILADQSGSIVIDIWKSTYETFPPTSLNSITAGSKPTLSSALKSQDTVLSGWDTALSTNETLCFNVDSASAVTQVILVIEVEKI